MTIGLRADRGSSLRGRRAHLHLRPGRFAEPLPLELHEEQVERSVEDLLQIARRVAVAHQI